jgi:HAD superfamily hydrolase (TIGR01509 family)
MCNNKIPWPVQSVVFDLDGLLVDTEPVFAETARRLLAKRAKTLVPSVLQAMMGAPARDALQLFRDHHQLEESVETLSQESSRLFYEVLGERPAPLMAGVLGLLDRLEQKRIPKAIATSSSRRYLDYILSPHGLFDRFAFSLTCDDVVEGKPAPEIYEKSAAHFNHPAREMLVLEDSPNGLRAARSAGAKCIVVPHDAVPMDQLEGADAIVSSLADPVLFQILGLVR